MLPQQGDFEFALYAHELSGNGAHPAAADGRNLGVDCDTGERTVRCARQALREKLAMIEDFKIVTVCGVGYTIEVNHA